MQFAADRLEAPTRYPHRSWRNLHLIGTQPIELGGHVAFAGWRREDVEAHGAGRRCRWAAEALCATQGKGKGADGEGLSVDRHPGGRSRRLLDRSRGTK